MIKSRRAWLLLFLTLAGCNRQDTQAMLRIANTVQTRSEAVTGDIKLSAVGSWHTVGDFGVNGRVAARLRWDKELADVPIVVLPCGSGVELRGKIRDLEQRRRAVMLAESTAGVDGVKDSLTEVER